VYVPSKRALVVTIPKCGSSSLRAAISSVHRVGGTSPPHLTLKQLKARHADAALGYAVLREPLDRLRSCAEYAMSSLDFSSMGAMKNKVFRAIKNKDTSHIFCTFYPQYSFLMADLPAKLYPIDSISLLLSEFDFKGCAPKENATPQLFCREEVKSCFGEDFIFNFYSIDFSFWSELNQTRGLPLFLDSAKQYVLHLKRNA
jgi:hypothetical protein